MRWLPPHVHFALEPRAARTPPHRHAAVRVRRVRSRVLAPGPPRKPRGAPRAQVRRVRRALPGPRSARRARGARAPCDARRRVRALQQGVRVGGGVRRAQEEPPCSGGRGRRGRRGRAVRAVSVCVRRPADARQAPAGARRRRALLHVPRVRRHLHRPACVRRPPADGARRRQGHLRVLRLPAAVRDARRAPPTRADAPAAGRGRGAGPAPGPRPAPPHPHGGGPGGGRPGGRGVLPVPTVQPAVRDRGGAGGAREPAEPLRGATARLPQAGATGVRGERRGGGAAGVAAGHRCRHHLHQRVRCDEHAGVRDRGGPRRGGRGGHLRATAPAPAGQGEGAAVAQHVAPAGGGAGGAGGTDTQTAAPPAQGQPREERDGGGGGGRRDGVGRRGHAEPRAEPGGRPAAWPSHLLRVRPDGGYFRAHRGPLCARAQPQPVRLLRQDVRAEGKPRPPPLSAHRRPAVRLPQLRRAVRARRQAQEPPHARAQHLLPCAGGAGARRGQQRQRQRRRRRRGGAAAGVDLQGVDAPVANRPRLLAGRGRRVVRRTQHRRVAGGR